jgi:hypothetical protein
VLDSLGFGSGHIVSRGKVGLHSVRVSSVIFHLLTTLSGYFAGDLLVQLPDLLGKLDAFGKLLSFDKGKEIC